jgi:hypothetical protein
MTRTGSMLALMPGTRTAPGTGANTGPRTRSPTGYQDAADSALARAGDGYFAWLDHIWHAAACTRPIRLHGRIRHIDTATGELLSDISTDTMPDRAVYKPCGNRRTSVCPGCAETYRRDAYHLIRAGLIGGKGISPAVASHPAVFATFTAPSFGPVHARPVRQHTCADRSHCACRPQPCHARREVQTCPHGRPLACFARHRRDDPALGQPLCPDCYDYPAHVVWNNQSGELWRRTKQAIERRLNQAARHRGLPWRVRVSHGKAAEYQARGAVHFHVLLRLDGIDPADPGRLLPPPPGITVTDLEDATRHAATAISYLTDPHPAKPTGWLIAWGGELDLRVITMRGTGTITDLAVASYLAKYSTKGTEITGHASTRITPETIGMYADPAGSHVERLIHACWTLGTHPAYLSLRRWAHMLGFGGHFLTKARRYSLRFRDLREARISYRRGHDTGPEHGPVRTAERTGEETTLIIGTFTYAGTGWRTTGDALLANTAADQARKRRQAGHDELADEYNRTTTGSQAA